MTKSVTSSQPNKGCISVIEDTKWTQQDCETSSSKDLAEYLVYRETPFGEVCV